MPRVCWRDFARTITGILQDRRSGSWWAEWLMKGWGSLRRREEEEGGGSNPLCCDVTQAVSKGDAALSVWAARRPVRIPGRNISVAGAQLSADRFTSDALETKKHTKMGKFISFIFYFLQCMLQCGCRTDINIVMTAWFHTFFIVIVAPTFGARRFVF